jgi:hypothetical protein
MKLDYKDAKVTWNFYDAIDWTKKVTHATEGFLSEDILALEYENCLIDLGWYGGPTGHFTIKVITPGLSNEKGIKYSSEDWQDPYVRIPCIDQYDMHIQLQRAINIYPQMINKTKE